MPSIYPIAVLEESEDSLEERIKRSTKKLEQMQRARRRMLDEIGHLTAGKTALSFAASLRPSRSGDSPPRKVAKHAHVAPSYDRRPQVVLGERDVPALSFLSLYRLERNRDIEIKRLESQRALLKEQIQGLLSICGHWTPAVASLPVKSSQFSQVVSEAAACSKHFSAQLRCKYTNSKVAAESCMKQARLKIHSIEAIQRRLSMIHGVKHNRLCVSAVQRFWRDIFLVWKSHLKAKSFDINHGDHPSDLSLIDHLNLRQLVLTSVQCLPKNRLHSSENLIVPKRITSVCFPYPFQDVGIQWLLKLHAKKVNGILADGFGLGKRFQVILFWLILAERKIKGPHLLVTSKSNFFTWQVELSRWDPHLRIWKSWETWDSSSALAPHVYVVDFCDVFNSKTRFSLKDVRWKTCVVDEALFASCSPAFSSDFLPHLDFICGPKVCNRIFVLRSELRGSTNHRLRALATFLLPQLSDHAKVLLHASPSALLTLVASFSLSRTRQEVREQIKFSGYQTISTPPSALSSHHPSFPHSLGRPHPSSERRFCSQFLVPPLKLDVPSNFVLDYDSPSRLNFIQTLLLPKMVHESLLQLKPLYSSRTARPRTSRARSRLNSPTKSSKISTADAEERNLPAALVIPDSQFGSLSLQFLNFFKPTLPSMQLKYRGAPRFYQPKCSLDIPCSASDSLESESQFCFLEKSHCRSCACVASLVTHNFISSKRYVILAGSTALPNVSSELRIRKMRHFRLEPAVELGLSDCEISHVLKEISRRVLILRGVSPRKSFDSLSDESSNLLAQSIVNSGIISLSFRSRFLHMGLLSALQPDVVVISGYDPNPLAEVLLQHQLSSLSMIPGFNSKKFVSVFRCAPDSNVWKAYIDAVNQASDVNVIYPFTVNASSFAHVVKAFYGVDSPDHRVHELSYCFQSRLHSYSSETDNTLLSKLFQFCLHIPETYLLAYNNCIISTLFRIEATSIEDSRTLPPYVLRAVRSVQYDMDLLSPSSCSSKLDCSLATVKYLNEELAIAGLVSDTNPVTFLKALAPNLERKISNDRSSIRNLLSSLDHIKCIVPDLEKFGGSQALIKLVDLHNLKPVPVRSTVGPPTMASSGPVSQAKKASKPRNSISGLEKVDTAGGNEVEVYKPIRVRIPWNRLPPGFKRQKLQYVLPVDQVNSAALVDESDSNYPALLQTTSFDLKTFGESIPFTASEMRLMRVLFNEVSGLVEDSSLAEVLSRLSTCVPIVSLYLRSFEEESRLLLCTDLMSNNPAFQRIKRMEALMKLVSLLRTSSRNVLMKPESKRQFIMFLTC